MFMTGQESIQDVLFFPQMRPEKKSQKDEVSAYTEIGIAEDWVPVLHKNGFLTVQSLKEVSPGALHQKLCGTNKKHKLGLQNPSREEVGSWLEKIS